MYVQRWWIHECYLLLVLLCVVNCSFGDTVLQTIRDTVGKEQYVHYRIGVTGHLRLELTSIKGDADVYVSATTLKPNFDNYDLMSSTCGKDIVDIPASFDRPVGVAVFGYPFHNESQFSLSVLEVTKSEDTFEYADLDAMFNKKGNEGDPRSERKVFTETQGNSISETFWTVLVTILKIVFDVLV